jgi:acetolactate synthase-1/2/3 large subunit
MSAEGYARVSKNFGVCLVSTGPASTNAVTGVACAWNDSVPVFFISGQANSWSLIGDRGMRQRGVHEVDIVSIICPITKYAIQLKNPKMIKYELDKCHRIMMSGRKGPVWLDIPLDLQSSMIDENDLYEDRNGIRRYSCSSLS